MIGGGCGLGIALAVGFLGSPVTAILVGVLALLYAVLLATGMPFLADGLTTESHLRILLRCPPGPSAPGARSVASVKPVAEARSRRKLNRRFWFQLSFVGSAAVGIATGLGLVIGVEKDVAATVSLIVIGTIGLPLLASGASRELNGEFPRLRGVIRSIRPPVVASAVVSIGVPVVVGYLVHNLIYRALPKMYEYVSLEMYDYVFLGVMLATLLAAFTIALYAHSKLRWMVPLAVETCIPFRVCLVETLALARAAGPGGLWSTVRIWAVPAILMALWSTFFGNDLWAAFFGDHYSPIELSHDLQIPMVYFGALFLPVVVVSVVSALATATLTDALTFRRLTGAPAVPVDALSGDPRAARWRLPRGSVLVTVALVLYPLANGWAYAKVTEAGGSSDAEDIGSLVFGFVVTTVVLVLALVAVGISRQPDSRAPSGLVGVLVAASLAVQIGGSILMVRRDAVFASDAGPISFATDWLTATCLLTAWLAGHRSRWLSVAVAPLGALGAAVTLRKLNDDLSYEGFWYSELVDQNFAAVARSFAAVAVICVATAWAAYLIDLMASRDTGRLRSAAADGPVGHEDDPGLQTNPIARGTVYEHAVTVGARHPFVSFGATEAGIAQAIATPPGDQYSTSPAPTGAAGQDPRPRPATGWDVPEHAGQYWEPTMVRPHVQTPPSLTGPTRPPRRDGNRTAIILAALAIVVGVVAIVTSVVLLRERDSSGPADIAMTPTSQAPVTGPSTSTDPTVAEPPPVAELSGTWRGSVTGDQDGFDVVAEISAGSPVRATVRYPQLACQGTWKETGRGDGTITLLETIDRGSCVTSYIVLIPESADTLSFRSSYHSDSQQRTLTIYALLRRR